MFSDFNVIAKSVHSRSFLYALVGFCRLNVFVSVFVIMANVFMKMQFFIIVQLSLFRGFNLVERIVRVCENKSRFLKFHLKILLCGWET